MCHAVTNNKSQVIGSLSYTSHVTVFANKVLKENLSKNFDTTIAVNSDQFYLQDFYTCVFSLNSFYSGTYKNVLWV